MDPKVAGSYTIAIKMGGTHIYCGLGMPVPAHIH